MYISVSSQTTLKNPTNLFGFALYDASAPTVLLETQTPDKPYGNPLQISFTYNCLNGHLYIIKLWESADGSATGIVRNSMSQAVNGFSVAVRMPEYLQVGITAGLVAGATSYVDTSWVNWNYLIRRNSETMTPDFTDNTRPNYHQDDTGGFSLIASGDIFDDEERFVVEFVPQVIPLVDGTPSPIFSSGVILTADTTLTNADVSKAIIIQSATNKIAVTLPALSSLADFSFLYFYSNGGLHVNAVFNCQGSDKIVNYGFKSNIILGQSEVLKIYKAFGKYYVDNDLTGVNHVGELIYSYYQYELNTILCNGQLISRTVYPRLWAWVQSLSGAVVSDAAWTGTFTLVDGVNVYTKKQFFSTGDGSTTFRLPMLTDMMLKGVDGLSRLPGALQLDALLNHKHEESVGNLDVTLFGKGTVPRRIGRYNGAADGFLTDLTSGPTGIGGDALERVSSENLVRTAGAFCLIRY